MKLIAILLLQIALVRGFSPILSKRSSVNLRLLGGGGGDEYADDKMTEGDRRIFDKIAQEFLNGNSEDFPDFPSSLPPKNPFSAGLNKASKEVLYEDDELMTVLSLHNELTTAETREKESMSNPLEAIREDDSPLGGIHDIVTSALQAPTKNMSTASIPSFDVSSQFTNMDIDDGLKQKIIEIRAIASDIDGTILTKKQTVHPRTRLAICKSIKSGGDNGIDYFFPATGKSRKGALDSLGIEIGSLIEQNCAGVYLQGLFCVDSKGEVVFEKKLDLEAIAAAESLVEEHNISLVAYDGDDLYTPQQTDIVIHLHEHYGEPLPILLPPLGDEETKSRKLNSHDPSMHKLLLMDDDVEKIANVIRPKLEILAKKHNACVTQAIPTMLGK